MEAVLYRSAVSDKCQECNMLALCKAEAECSTVALYSLSRAEACSRSELSKPAE